MVTIEYVCKTCHDAGPWSEDATGSDDKLIVKFHRDLGHDVVEYEEPESQIMSDYGIWDKEQQDQFIKNNRILHEQENPKYVKGMFQGNDKIDNVADELQKKYKFVTLRKTDEILQYDGKIYNSSLAESTINE